VSVLLPKLGEDIQETGLMAVISVRMNAIPRKETKISKFKKQV
jgi:hypothetical protein